MSDRITVSLTREAAEALLYAVDYACERDDEGIRSSEPEAVARSAALDVAAAALNAALTPLAESDRSWLRDVLQVQYDQAMDYSRTRDELLEWCRHIDAVAGTNGITVWEDGGTAVGTGTEHADREGLP